MHVVRSLVFALIFYPATALCVLAAFPAALIGTGPLRGVTHMWVRTHRWCARYLLGMRTRIEGVVPTTPVLVAAKHQSMYETMEIVVVLREPAVIMKRELSDIPFWGWVARRYGVIPVDREGGAAALRNLMRAAEAAIGEGRSIVIFPEGTRVAPGEQPPLQPGFAGLYRALKLPVTALALDSGLLWPRGSFVKRPGIVTFRFSPPIPAGLPRAEIEAAVHQAMNALEPQ